MNEADISFLEKSLTNECNKNITNLTFDNINPTNISSFN